MKINPLLFLIALATTVTLASSCGTRKQAGPTEVLTGKMSADELIKRAARSQFTAQWMDATAKIDLESPSRDISGTASIKIERDKRIWVSVRKFGFEGARALITPDSVFIINRLENEYTAEKLSYLEKEYKLPARFDLLQQILLGNPVYFERKFDVQEQDDAYELRGIDGGRYRTGYFFDKESYQTRRFTINEPAEKRMVEVLLTNYRDSGIPAAGGQFSYDRQINIVSEESGKARVMLEFKDVTFNQPTEMIFEVPDRYKKAD